MNNKMDVKKVISLGLSLAMGLFTVNFDSFASSGCQSVCDDVRMKTRLSISQGPLIETESDYEIDHVYSDFEESSIGDDYVICMTENEIYDELAQEFLARHDYTDVNITQNFTRVCAWKISKLVQERCLCDRLKNLSFIGQAYEVISAEDIDQSISESQIQEHMKRYSPEVINAVVWGMLGTEYETYYDIDENTFKAAEYILGNPYSYGTGGTVFAVDGRLCEMVKTLLDRGIDTMNIDLIEQSFNRLVLTDEYVIRFGGVSSDLVRLNINVFNHYNEKIIKSGIELSDRAKEARQKCIDSINIYKRMLRPKSRRAMIATVGCE